TAERIIRARCEYLTDGIIMYHDIRDSWASKNGKQWDGWKNAERLENARYLYDFETYDNSVTFTVDFGEYRDVTAVMVYQGKKTDMAFAEVKEIRLDVMHDGVEGTYVINHLAFSMEKAYQFKRDFYRPGNSAIARFVEVPVKSVTITIDKAPDAVGIAIPELVVLGKPKTANV
ncbi:MAG: hypothetical protein MJ072_06315, partial [Clostridia bacterium]|nr:hypothetical protein [Clostridia bacterium]